MLKIRRGEKKRFNVSVGAYNKETGVAHEVITVENIGPLDLAMFLERMNIEIFDIAAALQGLKTHQVACFKTVNNKPQLAFII